MFSIPDETTGCDGLHSKDQYPTKLPNLSDKSKLTLEFQRQVISPALYQLRPKTMLNKKSENLRKIDCWGENEDEHL